MTVQVDGDGAGAAVAQDVANALLRRAQHQVDDGLVDVVVGRGASGDLDPAVLQRRHQVLEAGEQRLAAQARRRDGHDEAAELAHGPPQVDGQPVQHLAHVEVPCLGDPRGLRREGVGRTAQPLHDAVVQVSGDALALAVARRQGCDEQLLALVVDGAQPAGHPPGQRRLRQPQQREPTDEHGRERQRPLAAGRGDAVVRVVGLEQQRGPVGHLTPDVDRHQPAEVLLRLVLVLVQVADLRHRPAAGGEDRELVRGELEALTDQLRIVGVDDRAVLRPDLDLDDLLADHALRDPRTRRLTRG